MSAETDRHKSRYIILFLTRHNESKNDAKTRIVTHHLRVSLARFTLCWWRHNILAMTSQWPDHCDANTWQVISNRWISILFTAIFTTGRVRIRFITGQWWIPYCDIHLAAISHILWYSQMSNIMSGVKFSQNISLDIAKIHQNQRASVYQYYVLPIYIKVASLVHKRYSRFTFKYMSAIDFKCY